MKVEFIDELLANSEAKSQISKLALGDSTGLMAFMELKQDSFVNLSLMAGTPMEAEIVFKKYLERFTPPKEVSLVFSFNQKYWEQLFWGCYVRRGFYSLEEAMTLYAQSRTSGSFPGSHYSKSGFLFRYFLSRMLLSRESFRKVRFLLLGNPSVTGKKTAIEYSREWNHRLLSRMHSLNGSLNLKMKRTISKSELDYLSKPFDPPSLYLQSFEKLLDLLMGHGVRVKVLLSPIHSSVLESVTSSSFMDGLVSYLKSIKSRYAGVHFDLMPTYFHTDYMMDLSHLNKKGSERFLLMHGLAESTD